MTQTKKFHENPPGPPMTLSLAVLVVLLFAVSLVIGPANLSLARGLYWRSKRATASPA